MANGYPDNAECWSVANGLKPAPPGAILCFAYAAGHRGFPSGPTGAQVFTDWCISNIWNVAAGVKIDAAYIAGYWQTFASAPDLADAEQAAWFHWYQAAVGYPGSVPGPGDGYVGNTLGSSDPRLRFVTAAGPAPHGTPDLTQAVAFGAAPAAPPPPTAPPPMPAFPATSSTGASQPAPSPAPSAGGTSPAGATGGSGPGQTGNSGGMGGSTSSSSQTQTQTPAAASDQVHAALAWLQKNPLEALAIAGGAYLLLFGVPSHGRR